ncbi:hypothetical protein KV205_11205 [Streptomyces sp. SKN60]|uniref:hypothetical protein n=1 Tax=Streptomyces sp. SKN60 TaxID=2855506 RepID=UPI002246757B|nr:hypothetical protein [Streptomyces sp. SKN60]MCX2181094.1 hypothetical protein [Streptomyces sp. SKN60]
MGDKDIENLQGQINTLRAGLNGKADASVLAHFALVSEIREAALAKTTGDAQVATQAWVAKETESKWWQFWKDPEVVGAAFAFTIFKFELMSLINFDPAIEKFFAKHGWERNRFGILWKLSEREKQRRERESPEYAIRRLQDMLVSAHTKIGNSNKRIGVLEKKVGRLTTRSNTSRQQIRHMESNPALQGTTDQVTLLQRRVDLLAQALS